MSQYLSKISDRTVPNWYRELLIEQYPTASKIDLVFLGHLMFTSFKDDETTNPLVPVEMLAQLEGKDDLLKKRNYQGYKYLDKFSKNIQPIEYSTWSYVDRKVRSIKVNWPQEVLDALEKVRAEEWNKENRVHLSSGRKLTYKSQMENMHKDWQHTLKVMSENNIPEATTLIDYMNNLQPYLFNDLVDNFPNAAKVARSLEKDSERQIDLLMTILDQKKPFYKTVTSSSRIFPANESILLLQRDVRKAFTFGFTEIDLVSAQLAIVAMDWKVQRVQKFLREGGNIWQHLAEHFEFELTSEKKQILKTATYAVCFGAGNRVNQETGKKTLKEVLKDLGEGAVKEFLSSPLIKAVWNARRRQFTLIKRNGGSSNCFGQWLSIKDFDKRSILAQKAQAYELLLLFPCVQMAVNNPDFQICLWQHDGFSLRFDRPEFKEPILREMKSLIDLKAKELGILTTLEVKE